MRPTHGQRGQHGQHGQHGPRRRRLNRTHWAASGGSTKKTTESAGVFRCGWGYVSFVCVGHKLCWPGHAKRTRAATNTAHTGMHSAHA
eukprot:6016053-Prymnesium_polylepis.1